MPARDHHHDQVRQALVKDGWTITHDPLRLRWGQRDMFVDLGAQQLLAAEKSERKIAVEIESFAGPSLIDDLEKAIGQFVLYRDVLATWSPSVSCISP
ncbi:element excision factor XisH family protein [Sorangium sp. So ce119]|uniref:element excision factor XisH family protein n=1 Tax=Sorangium sp. So ce119 TaxID=3133279 RepID=UPI003F628C63